jgi:hypothetical protein
MKDAIYFNTSSSVNPVSIRNLRIVPLVSHLKQLKIGAFVAIYKCP